MARPPKQGLDYFPLDIHFDDNVELIEAEYGLEGLAILVKLWQKIYQNGYYIIWNEDAELLFSKKINSELTRVSSVINSCLLRNLFSKETYKKYGILTSSGIQKRYLTACTSSKRKKIEFIEDYFLLEESYKKQISELTRLTPEETAINSEETPYKLGFTHEESTQRKGKERKEKGKESIFSEKPTQPPFLNSPSPNSSRLGECPQFVTDRIGMAISSGVTPELVQKYIDVTLERGKDNWYYFETMLTRNLNDEGIKTVEEYESRGNKKGYNPISAKKDRYEGIKL